MPAFQWTGNFWWRPTLRSLAIITPKCTGRPRSVRHRCRCRTRYSYPGRQALLFGPFSIFSNKFLKQGSWWDLLHSLTRQNLLPMLCVGLDNFALMRYLTSQLLMSNKDRINALREYYT
ncbi:MAG: malate:quinone oxidoreductase [Sodalis sp.]|nr:MAG: malate:quinone oxidoreductase [Sodalis sp.]